jgi:TrmH family RNA methyltransferase
MGEIEVAIMEPKYQINLGYIARISKNFGIRKLFLLNPRCNSKGNEAIKYSKHAKELLQSAKICKSLKEFDDRLIIGTTGIWHKTDSSFYNLYKFESIRKMIKRSASAGKNTIILLGRDDTGLSKEELRYCDATISLEADKAYPILNISHALAIILYELKGSTTNAKRGIYADTGYNSHIFKLFGRIVKDNKHIRDKRSVNMAFRHVLDRAMPTRKEINALSIALASNYKIKRKRK